MTEFEIIQRYFARRGADRSDVVVGIGDDAAVIRTPSGSDLVTAVDTLVEGVHFPPQTRSEDVGYKVLAVNLSDLAAMGAVPAWVTLAITLPQPDAAWLEGFAQGFFDAAERFGVQLVGGDTTRGPLVVTAQVQGLIPKDRAVRRAGARSGDLIFVTGTVGDAGLALHAWRRRRRLPAGYDDYLSARLNRPMPRCAEGNALRELASAMIDISDGLLADLRHILEASGVGATLEVDRVPLSEEFVAVTEEWHEDFRGSDGLRLALSAGDDYELCFTAPAAQRDRVEEVFSQFACGCRVIGVIEQAPGLRLRDDTGEVMNLTQDGYEHFAETTD